MTWFVKALKYAKTYGAALVPVYLTIESAITDGSISAKEWQAIIASLIGAVIVWAVPNANTNKQEPNAPPPSGSSSGPLE